MLHCIISLAASCDTKTFRGKNAFRILFSFRPIFCSVSSCNLFTPVTSLSHCLSLSQVAVCFAGGVCVFVSRQQVADSFRVCDRPHVHVRPPETGSAALLSAWWGSVLCYSSVTTVTVTPLWLHVIYLFFNHYFTSNINFIVWVSALSLNKEKSVAAAERKQCLILCLFSLDPCVFLKLFQFIRSRADNQATHTDWIQLDLQVTHTHTHYRHILILDSPGDADE